MRKYPLLILLWLCVHTVFSQQGHFFANISRSEGLASDDVYGICQDKDGFYWIATDNGLQRFDGQRWMQPADAVRTRVLSKPVFQVISQDSVLFLKMKEEFGTLNTSDFSYSPIKLETATKNESFLWKDSRGRIYLISKGKDIFAYDKQKHNFNKEASTIRYPHDLKPTAIFEDTIRRHYWICGINGIAVFNANTGETYTKENNSPHLPLLSDDKYTNVSALFIDSKRNHWIVYGGANEKYACYSTSEEKCIDSAGRLNNYYKGSFTVTDFYETADSQFWLFGKGALFNYMPENGTFYNTRSDIVNPVGPRFGIVRQMMQDNEKGVWIATDKGLYIFYVNLPIVKTLVFKTENDDNNITAATQLANGEIWMSSKGKGIIAVNNNKKLDLKNVFNNIPAEYRNAAKNAHTICRHSLTNNLWFGCEGGIIMVVDPVTRLSKILRPELSTISTPPEGWLGDGEAGVGSPIVSITENFSGQLFIGTSTGQIITYDHNASAKGAFRQIASLNSSINHLYADKQNRLWVCTNTEGVYSLNASTGKTLAQYNKETGLSSGHAKKIVRLNDSVFAIASDILNILDTRSDTIQHYSNKEGLSGNTIMTMENDPKGYLWISTSNGVCRFNLKKKRFASYGQKDGFIPFANFGTSSATLNNGEILFSGSNMLVTFPPDMYNNTKSPPAVRLTDIRVLDQYISVDSILNIRKASFAGDNNSLTIYFSAMSYFLQDKLTYYYRLSGVDNDWINGGNNASAAYTLLPPGKYVFEVKCENEEGLSSPVTSFHFSIRPPFWQTWWFVITVALIVAAFLFYLHRLRVNKILALSELRSRVARDLHDDVGSTLSTISILSTMAKTRLNEDSAVAGEYIGKISDNSQQMMEAMDDIVWSIKPMNDSMQKIIARMREVASGSLEPKNIDIDFYVDEKVFDLKLNMEARRDLFLIFKEAINNIAKYSGSSHVLIHISYLRKRLMLKIRDNGIGFDINKADNGNGLSNMKKRAAMLNARIKMYSDKQQGTQILLNIPIN